MSSRGRIIARDAELARLVSFTTGEMPSRALVLAGAPGIGKTTLWQAAVAAARGRGVAVHAARPAEQEVQLAFTAVADLLDGVGPANLIAVPAPQVRALEVALHRAEPQDGPAEPSAVAAGLTGALRALSGRGARLIAIDDAPWLDQASAAALAFAARRLRDYPVRFLLTRRPGAPSAVEAAFAADEIARVDLGPISLDATRTLLAERLDLHLPRQALLRLFKAAQGNPLVALELGRLLAEQGVLTDELPGLDGDLFAERLAALSEPVRRALLALALAGSLDRRELTALAGPLVVQDAVAAGVLAADGSRVRPGHPLLAAAARNAATAAQRRAVHLELAATLTDETLCVRHRALATDAADDALAVRAAGAAAMAIARGATRDAVELAEHASRLTSADSPERAVIRSYTDPASGTDLSISCPVNTRTLTGGVYTALAGAQVNPGTFSGQIQDSYPDSQRLRWHVSVPANMPSGATAYVIAWCVPASIPSIVITSGPPKATTQTFASFSFTGADPAGYPLTYTCNLDGAVTGCDSSTGTAYGPLGEGLHLFVVSVTNGDGE